MRTAIYSKINVELIVWPVGMLLLYLMTPSENSHTLCLFKNAGLPFCPGCGLGHGIHYFLHGQWKESLHHHWLSPVVVAVLLHRTIQLARFQYAEFK
ncbi:DUF2752 domain-containing protein [Chitinophaga sp. MM2321]|uniref:DUF2752 domain-containing protein n=1 Tax=Chitinophaga sp. MM2321 TaxID=3137178 RepID=UPI0032D5B062